MRGRKGTSDPTKQLLHFIFLALPVVLMMIFILMLATVRLTNDFERTPFSARAQIISHKILYCFGGDILDTQSITAQHLNDCYPVESDQRIQYPFHMTVEWTQGFDRKNITLASNNVYGTRTTDITASVLVRSEGKIYPGKVTFRYEEVI